MRWMWIVVAGIAPEPIVLGTAVTQYRARGDTGARTASLADTPLPPILPPVPEPVPAPAILPPNQVLAAALVAQQLPTRAPSLAEVKLRLPSGWQAPDSPLRLADRKV